MVHDEGEFGVFVVGIGDDLHDAPDVRRARDAALGQHECHLPIIVDPSHAVGQRDKVLPLAKAAKAVGADGIMVEMHPIPEKALSDGEQSLRFDQFRDLVFALHKMD